MGQHFSRGILWLRFRLTAEVLFVHISQMYELKTAYDMLLGLTGFRGVVLQAVATLDSSLFPSKTITMSIVDILFVDKVALK